MSGRQLQNWNEQADRDLLVAMWESCSPTQHQWRDIITRVQDLGYQYTVKAATQHLQKLKRKEPGGASAGADGGPKTPAKRGGRGGGASGSKRKAKAMAPVEDDDDLGDENIATPSKKPKVKRDKAKAEAAELDDPLQLDGVKNEIDDLDAAAVI